MKHPFRILCAVDASRPAAAAFDQALAMSVERGAQLVVVHAVSKHERYSWGAVERVAALATLRERAEALHVPVRVRVQQGDTASVILLHARSQAPDLIVLGAHEPAGVGRFLFQSIADRVVNGATCPVLLIPAAIAHPTPTFRNVLCAVDASSPSRPALSSVAALVGGSSSLTALYVVRDSVLRRHAPFGVPQSPRSITSDAGQRLRSMLDAQGLESRLLVTITSNTVADEILRVAADISADVVAVGATRVTAIRRYVLGSTALRVSRRSPLPVLVLPAVQVVRNLNSVDEAALGWAA